MAYQSNKSGNHEVYVRPFPEVETGIWQISRGGGTRPLWGPTGRELFFLDPSGRLMVARVQADDTFTAERPEVLIESRYATPNNGRTYDIHPDGSRFMMIKDLEQRGPDELHVIVNWFEELKRLVPTDGR